MTAEKLAVLAEERQHWSVHDRPYQFYDDAEYQLIVSLLSRSDQPGSLSGLRILEIGCGSGVWTRNLARLGARIYHFDLSPVLIKSACREAAPLKTFGFVADMHALPFAAGTFERTFGSMVIHHSTDHQGLGKEVARVLLPSGKAVFHENSARNPFLLFARRALVGRFGIPRNSSPSEYPLRPDEVKLFSSAFVSSKVHIGRMVFFQLAVKYLFRTETGLIFKLAERLDHFLFRVFPPLRAWSYYQILEALPSSNGHE